MDCVGAFCKVCGKFGKPLQQTGEMCVTKPFSNFIKAVEKKKAHEKVVPMPRLVKALAAEGALTEGSVI